MTVGPTAVLDASALMAWSLGEPGKDEVIAALDRGAAIGAANWAEFLSKAAEAGEDPDAVTDRLSKLGVLGPLLSVRPLDEASAREVARLRAPTRAAGDVFDFVTKRENVTKGEALRRVGAFVGVPLDPPAGRKVEPVTPESVVRDHARLLANADALDFLARARAIPRAVVERFRLGLQSAEAGPATPS